MPGSYLICLLTYSTIPNAAFPTDLIVKAENMYGIIAPSSNPAKIYGRVKEMLSPVYRSALCKNPPKSERDTKAALPIAKPFPIAAVVFPAASKASVLYLTYSPISAISAIPPALSLIGP